MRCDATRGMVLVSYAPACDGVEMMNCEMAAW
jgi:hypothetical protein